MHFKYLNKNSQRWPVFSQMVTHAMLVIFYGLFTSFSYYIANSKPCAQSNSYAYKHLLKSKPKFGMGIMYSTAKAHHSVVNIYIYIQNLTATYSVGSSTLFCTAASACESKSTDSFFKWSAFAAKYLKAKLIFVLYFALH